jgi:hypothetical protein
MVPTALKDLTIEEISLVDFPACSTTDPKTGKKIRRAVVSLFKRDYDADPQSTGRLLALQERCQAITAGIEALQKDQADTAELSARILKYAVESNREHHHEEFPKEIRMSFSEVLKSAKNRDEIIAAVETQALKIAKRDGISVNKALAEVWTDEAYEAYEVAPKGEPQRPIKKMFKATKAEGELDTRARTILKASGMSYPQACSQALEEDPSLYTKYQSEVAAGSTYSVPDPQYGAIKYSKQDDDEDGDTCPECDEDVEAGDKFCSACGEELPKQKSKSKPKSEAK